MLLEYHGQKVTDALFAKYLTTFVSHFFSLTTSFLVILTRFQKALQMGNKGGKIA